MKPSKYIQTSSNTSDQSAYVAHCTLKGIKYRDRYKRFDFIDINSVSFYIPSVCNSLFIFIAGLSQQCNPLFFNLIGTLRLVDTAETGGGRAEVLVNGTWGSVCVSNLSSSHFTTCLCRALGLAGGRFRAFATSQEIGQGQGPIHASGFWCTQEGLAVDWCSDDGCGCNHEEDVYVGCAFWVVDTGRCILLHIVGNMVTRCCIWPNLYHRMH